MHKKKSLKALFLCHQVSKSPSLRDPESMCLSLCSVSVFKKKKKKTPH